MANIVHMSVFVHTTAPCSICLFGVCPRCLPVLTWTNLSACGCLLAPLSGITLTTRAIRSQHFILFNSYKLVRAPRLLCRCRPPHESHMVQRLQVLCPAHRSHSVPSVHRFRWAPRALSQETFCQLRSLRLPRSSPLQHSWSVASLLMLLRRPSYPVPTPPLDAATQTFPHTAVSQDVSTQLSLREFLAPPSAHHVLCPTCARPVPSLLLDAAVHTPLHSVATHDASTPLPLTEFFIGCILSNDPLDRQALPSAHCNSGSASPPPPPNIATLCSFSSASHASDGHADTTAPRVSYHSHHRVSRSVPVNLPHMVLPVKAAPVRPHLFTSISVTLPQPHVSTTQVGTHPVPSATTCKRSASTALAGTHNPVGAHPRAGTGPFPKPRALVLPTVKFGQYKPDGLGYSDTVESDLTHHEYRLSVLQWNPGPARRHPTNIIAAACGKFHAVILQEASDHVPHISDQFLVCTGNSDLAILLNNDTFEPSPFVFAFKEDSTSKGTWGMVLLIVRGLLRRPSLSGTPTVKFCSVHIHNVVAKKRDASTDLLRRLHGYMKQHSVDFICGDFNMSAFSRVGDVFTDDEFSAPGNSLLWNLVHWRSRIVNVLVFSSVQSDLTSGVSIHMAATSLKMRCLAWDLETNLLIFRCFFIFAIPICPDPAVSCVVSKHNKEDLSADTTKNERMQRRRS